MTLFLAVITLMYEWFNSKSTAIRTFNTTSEKLTELDDNDMGIIPIPISAVND